MSIHIEIGVHLAITVGVVALLAFVGLAAWANRKPEITTKNFNCQIHKTQEEPPHEAA